MLQILLAAFVILAVALVAFFKHRFQYWKSRNLPYIEPSIPFGSLSNPFFRKAPTSFKIKSWYDHFRKLNVKHGGSFFYAQPAYVVTDLDLLKNILVKDFQHFVDRGVYVNEKDDPIGAHLFALGGVKWRNLRTKLTPTFTSGKMKMMFQTLVDCEASLQEVMSKHYENGGAIDIKDVLGCFTTDIIGSCAFGLECNTFKDADSPFRRYGKKVFESNRFRTIKSGVASNFPAFGRALGLRQIPKDIGDFFMKVVKDTVEYRERNNVTRKDFLQLLIDLKNKGTVDEDYLHDGNTLTIEEVAAQSFIFFLAGFETSSTTMTFALYEMAKHQDVQQKVRDEIEQVLGRYGGQITYEAIGEMKYMNQVIDETLRKYPPVPVISRKCVKAYKVPDSDLVIEEGISVLVPILGIHRDEKHYPDPLKFDPERFNEENKKNRHPMAHIPFGEGPRICIGLRFGMMQSKVGLTALLKNYKFSVNPKTREPLKFATHSFIMAADGDVWLTAEKLDQKKNRR